MNKKYRNIIIIIASVSSAILGRQEVSSEISDNTLCAVKYAVQKIIREGDSLLIAGKGHETYQIIGKEKRHFDDRETVKKHLI